MSLQVGVITRFAKSNPTCWLHQLQRQSFEGSESTFLFALQACKSLRGEHSLTGKQQGRVRSEGLHQVNPLYVSPVTINSEVPACAERSLLNFFCLQVTSALGLRWLMPFVLMCVLSVATFYIMLGPVPFFLAAMPCRDAVKAALPYAAYDCIRQCCLHSIISSFGLCIGNHCCFCSFGGGTSMFWAVISSCTKYGSAAIGPLTVAGDYSAG